MFPEYSFVTLLYSPLAKIGTYSPKGTYSDSLPETEYSLILTKYLTDIFEMRFLIRNCLKYTQQCQNGISEKSILGNNGTLIHDMW